MSIKVENLSKIYKLYDKPIDRLKESIHPFRKKYHRDFYALKDINFEIEKGETVGIIGKNGSGKSTLLKIISGVLTPTSGIVTVNGKVSALLELGTGFNPEMTGLENVYFSGTIMGYSRGEIDARLEAILTFADIGEFIYQPVKTYSNGMFVRLAFSAAINVDPDILVVDEALAVGDAKFQAKCFRKFEEFQKKNKTILFVTHSTDQVVRHCNRAIFIDDGMKLSEGEPRVVSNQYLDLLFGKITPEKLQESKEVGLQNSTLMAIEHQNNEKVLEFIKQYSDEDRFIYRKSYNKNEYRWGNRHAEIVDYFIISGRDVDPVQCDPSEQFNLYLKVKFDKDIERPIYGLNIKTVDGLLVYGNNSRDWDSQRSYFFQKAGDVKVVCFSFTPRLNSGNYMLSVGIAEDMEDIEIPLDRRYDAIHLFFTNRNISYGPVDLGLKFEPVT